jgi:hypothetical protein
MGLVSGPKKTGQLVAAVGALAALVFGVTFAVNYLGNSGGTESKTTPDEPSKATLSLNFPVKKYPPDEESALEVEMNKAGFHDFWFQNDNDQPVKLGLIRKNCTCSSVELYAASPDAPITQEVLKDESKVRELQGKIKPVDLAHADANVPPGTTGWVRLSWSGARPIDRLGAELWMDDKERGDHVRLETLVKFLGAMLVDNPTRDVGVVRAGGVPVQASFFVFSCTRNALHFKAEPVEEPNLSSSPFAVSQPVQVPDEELRRMEKQQAPGAGSHVRCGYRFHVTVRERSADGKDPIDLGPFRRVIRLTSTDEGVEPLEVIVTGIVEGEVSVIGDDQGRVLFQNFPASRGKVHAITLRADSKDIDLEVFKKPEFLKAELSKPEEGAFGRRTWRLRLEVLPNKITGAFPRYEDPDLRDCALYLSMKTKGDYARRIRIPVSGMASSN